MIVKGRNVSTATAALACRIYGHCHPGWGHTYADVAEALDVSPKRVQRCAVAVGWNGRFTAVSGRDRIDEITGGGMRDMYPTSADLEPIRRMAAMAGGRGMTRAEILDAAAKIVTQDRNASYGGPERSFETIAQLWAIHLGYKITASDVAIMMALLKIARLSANPAHADSWIDLAGYAACGGEVSLTGG